MHKRTGRRLKEPKPEHSVVLRAVEIVNLAFRRVASVDEIISALTAKEVGLLETTYANDLSTVISKILQLLRVRGAVFSPGKVGTRYYYGVAGVLDPATASLPTEESRRRRVLELVRQVVVELGRAVRTADVLEYAASSPNADGLLPDFITHDILSLKETGEMRIVGSVRGDGKGIHLYLPAEMNPEDYALAAPPTWLEEVAQTFNELWGERTAQAAAEGRNPRLLSTGDVRERLRTSTRYPENLADPIILVNAMQQLAQTRNLVVRKIRRPKQKAVLWAPAGVKDSALDAGNAYASDVERVSEAVRRAENALARPVTMRDVRDQIELDPSLQPTGSSRLISVLSEAAKERIASGENGSRRSRVVQHVYRIGKVADVSYYSTGRTPEAEAFIKTKRLELRWSAMRVGEELETFRFCSLPTVAIGRAMLALADTADMLGDLDILRSGGHLRGEQRQTADELFNSITEAADFAREWLKDHVTDDQLLPKSVNRDVPGWTVDELLEVIKPLYPRSQTLSKNSQLLGLMGDVIRRVPNPEYVTRFSTNQRAASEYLFDRADALIYVAKEWGGYECCLQATLAGNELGHLRDMNFVLPALDAKDFSARLAAVACLAFLQSEAGNERLRDVAVNDSDPGVRQSALWAYGFVGEKGACALLESRRRHDADPRVRSFAQQILRNSEESWWAF
jgi:HEAT repeats